MLSADNSLPKHSNIVAYPTESYFGQIISNYQQTQRLSLNGPVAVESAFSVGIVQFVLAGTGAAWLPHSMIYDEVISGDVVILSQDYGRIPLDITVYSHKSNSKIGRFWARSGGLTIYLPSSYVNGTCFSGLFRRLA